MSVREFLLWLYCNSFGLIKVISSVSQIFMNTCSFGNTGVTVPRVKEDTKKVIHYNAMWLFSVNSTEEEETSTLRMWEEDRNLSKSLKEGGVVEQDLEGCIGGHQVELQWGDSIPDEGNSKCRGMLREQQVLLKAWNMGMRRMDQWELKRKW